MVQDAKNRSKTALIAKVIGSLLQFWLSSREHGQYHQRKTINTAKRTNVEGRSEQASGVVRRRLGYLPKGVILLRGYPPKGTSS